MGTFNYFNYFTEIEEHFWKMRGAHLLVSPLDWAIVETWQKAGIPLPVVLKGIDRAFESWERSKRAAGGRQLKSLAYCVDAVLDTAAEAQEASAGAGPESGKARSAEPFSRDELHKYIARNSQRLRTSGDKWSARKPSLAQRLREAATRVEEATALIDTPGALDLEELERRLTVLEEKLSAALSADADEETMVQIRREMDRSLAPYRRKMSGAQLAQLERQYMQKRLFEQMDVPRLSLFYLV
jgi:hypothetical protein